MMRTLSWRTRSLVMLIFCPISSRVFGFSPSRPAHPQDLPFARIQVFEQPIHSISRLFCGSQALLFVAARVGRGFENFLMPRQITLAAMLVIRNAAGEVLHDGPAGVGAEFVASTIVEFLHSSNQGHVAIG